MLTWKKTKKPYTAESEFNKPSQESETAAREPSRSFTHPQKNNSGESFPPPPPPTQIEIDKQTVTNPTFSALENFFSLNLFFQQHGSLLRS